MRQLGKAVVLLALLAVPADAHGATPFGGTLDGVAPDNSLNGSTTFNYVIAGAQLTAPSDGVITRMRVRHGATNATPGSVAFRILTQTTFPSFTARPATASGADQRVHLPPNDADGGIVSVTPNDGNDRRIGIPVAAGERLAVHQNGSATIASEFNGPHQVRWFSGDHATGTQSYGTGAFLRVQIDALLEPDRDRDRYGDETQDNCPSIANDQTSNPCPPATVTVPGPSPAPVVVERVVPLPPATSAVRLCRVPRLRGLTLAKATARLRRAGCVRGRRTGSRSRRARVRAQTIPAGTRVVAGTRVGVTLRLPVTRRRR